MKHYYPYINGRAWESEGQPVQNVINPYTGEAIARVHLATAADIQAALASAEQAQKTWGKTLAKEREAILCKAADIVERRRMDIAKVLIEEGGNVFGKAMFECDYMISTFRIAAGQARDVRGETMPADQPNRISMSIRQPLGVVAGILEEAGLPPGVLSVIPTTNEAVGDTLFSDPRVKLVTFTGSAKVGCILADLAGRYSKRIVLELGGKSPIVILADADLDYAVRSAAFGIYFNQGQVCMANSRIIVEAPIYERFCKAFAEKVRSIAYGDPALPQTAVGPLINPQQADFIRNHIDDAIAKGATLLAGGERHGNVFEPSVLAGVKPGMEVYNEESFGPLASIFEARDYEHAVELANDNSYGLSSGIITNDLQKAFDFALRVEAGSVHINDNSFDDDPNAPFGGFKESGHGKENGRYSVHDMTELKWVTVQLGERQLPF